MTPSAFRSLGIKVDRIDVEARKFSSFGGPTFQCRSNLFPLVWRMSTALLLAENKK